MARPRSDDKRKAILDAALQVVAERGITNAPTSAISEAAGVAEGSIFTYFKCKEALMDALYEHLRGEFSRQMGDFPYHADARTRLKYVWDKYLDMGAKYPEQLEVLTQLRASGRIYREDETPTLAVTEVMRGACEATAESSDLCDAPPEYLVLMLRAQAEITVEFVQARPELSELCREVGFKMLWKGLTGK
jgi:AcrR family transcriptional regulator